MMPAPTVAPIISADEQGIAGANYVSLSRLVGRARQDGRVARAVAEVRAREAQTGRARETLSTSDFTYMADQIDRGMMVGYLDNTVPTTFERIGRRRDTTDVARADGNGRGKDYRISAARLVPRVAEGAEYLPNDPTEESFEFATWKYGWQWDLTFEAWLADNRDLGMLSEYPESWGLSARYTQEYRFTNAYAGNTTFFSNANDNLGTGALNEANLQTGIAAVRKQSDPSSNVAPYMGPLYLMVPPDLELTARSLVESTTVVQSGGESVTVRAAGNRVNQAAEVVVNHFLPTLDTDNGTTAWYLFCDPRIRPALRYGYLSGYEEPQVYIKDSDARMMFGQASDPFDGDYLTDSISFKTRFFFGADTADYRGGYMSTGAG